jgi:hypothetical protein
MMRWPWVSAARLDDAFHELHQRAARIQSLEAQLDGLRADQCRLLERVVSPAPLPSRPVMQPTHEEGEVLGKLRDETVEKLAQHLQDDAGLDAGAALAEARRMAKEAELLFT